MDNIANILKDKFYLDVKTSKYIGCGYDSKVYLINDTFIFKFAKHQDAIRSYKREYKILKFLKNNYHHPINIPIIEYFDASGIIGYKNIEGTFLTKELYLKMSDDKKEKLTHDLSQFIKYLHSLDTHELIEYKENLRESFIADLELLKKSIFSKLSNKEKEYVEKFISKVISDKNLFDVPYCICHNDLSANHILLDDEFNLCGIIDFGDACLTQDYRDFIYLLEDSEEEIGSSFGKSIIEKYEYKNKTKALTIASIIDEYYPIETIVCGIENDDELLLKEGLELLRNVLKNLN